jgi:putative transposase
VEFARQEVQKGTFSVNRICQLTGISKATFYAHKHPQEQFESKYAHLKKKVEKIIQKNPAYGIKRINQALFDKFKIVAGRDSLGKLLIAWGLSLKRRIKKKPRSVIQKILISLSDRANLLIRTALSAPLQAITSDISELVFNGGKGKCYLAVHKDALGQMVYGHEVAEHMETALVLKSLKKAIQYLKKKKIKIPKSIIFHSDQGSQFTSYEYVAMILLFGKISYSTPGTPTENPGQESFFGRFKDEWRDEIKELKSFAEVKKFIESKIKYYNYQRLHTSIKNQTPYFFTKNSLKF